jgi:hypothetical protein
MRFQIALLRFAAMNNLATVGARLAAPADVTHAESSATISPKIHSTVLLAEFCYDANQNSGTNPSTE